MKKETTIPNFKIKYNNQDYDKITNFGIDNWENKVNVHFTNRDSEQKFTNINCTLDDIEIIRE